MWKHFISSYFSFTKKDRTGILVLVSLIIFFMLLPFFYSFFIKEKTYDHRDFEKAITALRIKQADSAGNFEKKYPDKNTYQHYNKSSYELQSANAPFKGEMFFFDPNSTTTADWKRLGIRDKTIATIQNYLSKGGKFYKKEDLGKIWGLKEEDVSRLTPYVRLPVAALPEEFPSKKYEKKEYKPAAKILSPVDVNIADSNALVALPGIGSKLSRRILNFRGKLGGFYKVEQVGETFGLPDSVFQKIKPLLKIDNAGVRQININTATMDELRAHPYIRYVLSNSIIQYRAQHGNYTAVDDIKKIMTVTEDLFNKVAPYLTVK